MIPISIASSTASLKVKLDKLIDDISRNAKAASENEFSITDWFYVSSMVAKRRPDIPESSIILRYRTSNSVNISKTFNSLGAIRNDCNEDVRITQSSSIFASICIILGAFTSSLLKALNIATIYLGVLPESMQMILIRCIQPALLTIVVNFGVLYPQLWVIIAIFIFLIVYSFWSFKSTGKVTPAEASEEKISISVIDAKYNERKDDKIESHSLKARPIVQKPSLPSSSYSSSSSSGSSSLSGSSTLGGSLTPASTPPNKNFTPQAAQRPSIQQDRVPQSKLQPPPPQDIPQVGRPMQQGPAPSRQRASLKDFSNFNNFSNFQITGSDSSDSDDSDDSDNSDDSDKS